MVLTKKRKIKKIKKTKKNYQQIVCKEKMHNSYNTFEDKIEKAYGKLFSDKKFNLEKVLNQEFKKPINEKGITPQDDFYSYINDRWINNVSLFERQKYIVQIDNFRLIQDKVYYELIDIIKEEIKDTTKNSKIIKNFYTSQLKLNTNEQSRNYANESLNQIDELRKNKNNIWKLLGLINNNEIITIGCPFTWTLNPDEKEPTKFRCYVDSPQLSLIDINVYFDDGIDVEYKRKTKKAFFKYLKELFENAFGPQHKFIVEDVFKIELEILNAMGCFKIKTKEKLYNKVTAKESMTKYKFDWPEFSKEIGFNHTPPFFITSNLNYLICGTEMLMNNWDNDSWRTYWIYLFIRQQQRWNKLGREISFNFLGKYFKL